MLFASYATCIARQRHHFSKLTRARARADYDVRVFELLHFCVSDQFVVVVHFRSLEGTAMRHSANRMGTENDYTCQNSAGMLFTRLVQPV